MSAKFEQTETNKGILTFEIPYAEAEAAMKDVYNNIKGQVQIPGFRKGKVTYKMYTKMFGEESLYEDALNQVLPNAYEKAVEAVDADIVGQPKINADKMDKGEDWVISAQVITKPEVKLGDYKDLEVPAQDREVTEEEVNQRLEAEQAKQSELVLKEGAAEEGDTVVIDFEGFKDGEAFEGGQADNHSLELGSGSFIPGFEEQLVGASEGEAREVKVTFPEDYQAEELAGQEAIFKVTVHEVKTKEVPELDDEFAKDVNDEVETLDELKAKIREELQTAKDAQAKDAVDEAAIRKAVENAEIVDLPQEMIDDEVNHQVEHYLNDMQRQGISAELFFQITGTTDADLRKQFEDDADTRVKTNLILEQVVADENLEATDEDVDSEIKELAEQYGMDEEAVKQVVTVDMLKNDIKLKKAMALITDTAVEK